MNVTPNSWPDLTDEVLGMVPGERYRLTVKEGPGQWHRWTVKDGPVTTQRYEGKAFMEGAGMHNYSPALFLDDGRIVWCDDTFCASVVAVTPIPGPYTDPPLVHGALYRDASRATRYAAVWLYRAHAPHRGWFLHPLSPGDDSHYRREDLPEHLVMVYDHRLPAGGE